MFATLEFKWTTSKARDSYGYTICSLWISGRKVAWCDGGGYDMIGAALAEWIQAAFHEELKKLKADKRLGLSFCGPEPGYKNHKTWRSGDSIEISNYIGIGTMIKLLRALGHNLESLYSNTKVDVYQLTKRPIRKRRSATKSEVKKEPVRRALEV